MHQVLRYRDVIFANSEIKLPAEDLPEVVTGKTYNPFYLLMMLFYSVVLWFRNQSYIPTHAIRFWKVDIGQSSDSNEWVARYCEAWAPKEPVIFFGVSRGALVTFKKAYFLAKTEVPKLVILEGCPDSIPNVIEARYGSIIGGAIEWALQLFTRYNAKRARLNSALSCVDDFPRDVPVAFITSEKDTTVPPPKHSPPGRRLDPIRTRTCSLVSSQTLRSQQLHHRTPRRPGGVHQVCEGPTRSLRVLKVNLMNSFVKIV